MYENSKEQMVLHVTRSKGDRWCSALPWVLSSHAENTDVARFQGGLNDWANGSSHLLFFPLVNLGESHPTVSALYSRTAWGLQGCLHCILLAGVFHLRPWSFKQAASGTGSSVLLTFWGFAEILFGGRTSLMGFEEHNIESTCTPFGLAFCVLVLFFFVVHEEGVEGWGGGEWGRKLWALSLCQIIVRVYYHVSHTHASVTSHALRGTLRARWHYDSYDRWKDWASTAKHPGRQFDGLQYWLPRVDLCLP